MKGPQDLAANLKALVGKNQPELSHFKAICPPQPTPPDFPVRCRMTAIDTSKLNKRNVPDGEHRPISGTVTVTGVYAPTQTYIYTLQYRPTGGS